MNDRLVSDSTTIDAPPDVVFAIVTDPRQHARIVGSGTLRGAVIGPDRLWRHFGAHRWRYEGRPGSLG